MAIIYNYPTESPIGGDKVLGIDTSDARKTVVFTIDSIIGAGSAGVFSTATLSGALSAKTGISHLKSVEVDNLANPPSTPDYDDYSPSTYIVYPAVTHAVHASVGIGSYALQNETTALSAWWTTGKNVAVGTGAGRYNTTGLGNVYLGYEAGYNSTTASGNVYIGFQTGKAGTSGQSNVAIGNSAAISNTTGIGNLSLGYTAGQHLTTSGYTVNVGANAGKENADASNRTSGNYNVYIGPNTKGSINGTTNENVFGNGAIGEGTNTVRLGNTAITEVVTSGDVETDTIGKGFILKSPDGTRYRITVANGGTLSATTA
jgi:hypothetical protein